MKKLLALIVLFSLTPFANAGTSSAQFFKEINSRNYQLSNDSVSLMVSKSARNSYASKLNFAVKAENNISITGFNISVDGNFFTEDLGNFYIRSGKTNSSPAILNGNKITSIYLSSPLDVAKGQSADFSLITRDLSRFNKDHYANIVITKVLGRSFGETKAKKEVAKIIIEAKEEEVENVNTGSYVTCKQGSCRINPNYIGNPTKALARNLWNNNFFKKYIK
jgi:hypothetical protein